MNILQAMNHSTEYLKYFTSISEGSIYIHFSKFQSTLGMGNRDGLRVLAIILFSLIKLSDQTTYTCNPSASCGCSANSATLTRIVGGETAASATWGWAVSISIANTYLCGGSILSSSWVITAAHCVKSYSASQITIYAGSIARFSGTQSSVASNLYVHPSYNSVTYANDLALLKLATPLSMSDSYVSTICLPTVSSATLSTGEWPPVNTSVVAVGWGALSQGGSLPTYLQQVTLQTVAYNAATCAPSITDWHIQLCAGVSGGGKDTCQGDSGGPLMMFNSNNQWVLIGTTSFGIGCGQANNSGIYTRVAAFQDWINATMNTAPASIHQLPILVLLFSSVSTLMTTYVFL